MSHSKRPHVKTERMQEFMRAQGDANSPTKKIKCPEPDCDKMFTSTPGLKYHLQTHKTKNPQFSCKKCLKVFKSANGLKYHRGKKGCDDTDLVCTDLLHTFQTTYEDTRKNRPIPSRLDLTNITETICPLSPSRGMDKLTELAIIATSPQSPLLQRPKPPWETKPSRDVVRSLVETLDKCENIRHGNETEKYSSSSTSSSILDLKLKMPPAVDSMADSTHMSGSDGSDPRVSTSSPLCVSPDDSEKLATSTWSHSWPTAVWQCFITGTMIKFLVGAGSSWQKAETIAQKEDLTQQAAINLKPARYAPNGLLVMRISEVLDHPDQSEIEIHFTPSDEAHSEPGLLAVCKIDHPFFVKDKGWSSCNPCETVGHYGIPCRDLCVGDVCLPPSHPDASSSEDIFKSCEDLDFTPEDTSAVLALNSMKQHKNDTDLSPSAGSSPTKYYMSGITKSSGFYKQISQAKAKRPMNAFLLFAKECRTNYTQKYPKRDNREISVMLGEQWKALSAEERKVYEEMARELADQQKKMHPDCWKRKK